MRRRRRKTSAFWALVALAGCAALAAVFVPGGRADAESCSYDQTTKKVTATVESGSSATLVVVGGELWFGLTPAPCSGATTTNTNSITINGSAGTNEQVVLDESGGVFGPGATLESSSISEIEIAVNLGDTVIVNATNGNDTMAAGQNGIALNGDGDVDVTLSPSNLNLQVSLFDGNDYFNGRGQFGAGLHYLGPLTIDGGDGDDSLLRGSAGNDVILGGAGNDHIEGQEGNDVVDGGSGNDSISAGAGDDTLTGGSGADSLIGGLGNDLIYANDVEADTQIAGNGGIDTAYYDAALDPSPVSIEHRFPS